MTTLKFGMTEARKLRDILNPEWKLLDKDLLPELDAVCLKVLEAAVPIVESREKFAVVSQIYWTEQDGMVKSFDPQAEKLVVVYSTEGEAAKAAESLQGGGTSKELLKTWVLPVWHQSPNEWRKARRRAQEAAEVALRGGTSAEKLVALIEEQDFEHCGHSVNRGNASEICWRPIGHPGSHWARPLVQVVPEGKEQ